MYIPVSFDANASSDLPLARFLQSSMQGIFRTGIYSCSLLEPGHVTSFIVKTLVGQPRHELPSLSGYLVKQPANRGGVLRHFVCLNISMLSYLR